MTKSKSKIEQKAITKVRDLIDKIEFFKHDLKDTDKNISWDGTVEMYNGNTDIKENYDYTIDVQVKGRTTNNKKFSSKYRFPLDKIDLENYLKKDGTILIVCLFKKDENDYKLYYSNLLPYNIRSYLKEFSSNKIKISMKEIKDSEHFENICRNFKLDKEMQKGIKANIFNEDNLYSTDGKVAKFYTWDKDLQNFNPQSLVGSWKYIYTLDKNGYTINVSYGMLSNLIETLNVKIYNKNKKIEFDDVKLETTVDGKKIFFGKAFTIDFVNKKFNIKISGTLNDRIKQLEFIEEAFINCGFLINNFEFYIEPNNNEQKKFEKIMKKYKKLREFFTKHSINKEINFDNWEDKDFNKLEKWIDAIENGTLIKLNSNISMMGSIDIRDIKLSIFATKEKSGEFKINSIWNNNMASKYYFKYGEGKDSLETRIFYLALNSQAYESDDINFQEMKNYFDGKILSDDEYILLNLQLLEVLKAYDITRKTNLLEYSKYLSRILLKHEPDSPIYYINYAQILKRENKLSEQDYKKLIELRDMNSSIEIKICCNLLLDNKSEANILIGTIDEKTLEEFKKYPIAIYI